MSQTERLEFFRKALALCVRWKRSPQIARVIEGRPHTLREVMQLLNEGGRLPAVTAVEARTLAGEFPSFAFSEILTGLSGRNSARASRPGQRGTTRTRSARRAAQGV